MARPKVSAKASEKISVYVTEEEEQLVQMAVFSMTPEGKVPSTSKVAAKVLVDWAKSKAQKKPVPILGLVPGGPEVNVQHLPPGTKVRPPFDMREDCYGLIVFGNSMESKTGVSIDDGSYAFFCPALDQPHWGTIVHAEFPQASGESTCTLKIFKPQSDGSAIFEPINKEDHRPFHKKAGEFEIKGVFLRAWDGKTELN